MTDMFRKILAILIMTYLSLGMGLALAETDTVVDPKNETHQERELSFKNKIVKMVVALAGVIGLIMAASWFYKKTALFKSIRQNPIQVISVMPISQKQKLSVIEIGGAYLLIGITEQSINRLHELSEEQIRQLLEERQ